MTKTPTCSNALRDAIRLEECLHDSLCHGFRWHIQDESALATLVAWTMLGQYQHAERVLTEIKSRSPALTQSSKAQAIGRLTLPANTGNVTIRWHRDGLVFQHIAWIAAVLEGKGNVATLMPHMRPADKGFDSLLIPLDSKRAAVNGLFICEEKATENPRQQINGEVWPSILGHEAGNRDAELNAYVMSILREHSATNIEQIAADIHWLNKKAYRVSVTISDSQNDDKSRKALFHEYDTKAPGAVARRRAETVALQDLRKWMDSFSKQIIDAIEKGQNV